MPIYVILTTLTDEGIKSLKRKPRKIKEYIEEVVARFGMKTLAQYVLMGPYDFVSVLEAPDNDTVVKLALDLGSRGTMKTLTMPAIEVNRLVEGLKELAAGIDKVDSKVEGEGEDNLYKEEAEEVKDEETEERNNEETLYQLNNHENATESNESENVEETAELAEEGRDEEDDKEEIDELSDDENESEDDENVDTGQTVEEKKDSWIFH